MLDCETGRQMYIDICRHTFNNLYSVFPRRHIRHYMQLLILLHQWRYTSLQKHRQIDRDRQIYVHCAVCMWIDICTLYSVHVYRYMYTVQCACVQIYVHCTVCIDICIYMICRWIDIKISLQKLSLLDSRILQAQYHLSFQIFSKCCHYKIIQFLFNIIILFFFRKHFNFSSKLLHVESYPVKNS